MACFMDASLELENYASTDRKMPMKAFSTISSGYDSTAVTSVVMDIGVTTCFSSKGRLLGAALVFVFTAQMMAQEQPERLIKVKYLNLLLRVTEDEVYFLATNIAKFWESSLVRQYSILWQST